MIRHSIQYHAASGDGGRVWLLQRLQAIEILELGEHLRRGEADEGLQIIGGVMQKLAA